MTVSPWQANGEQPTHQADVVILGAGLIGCTAALFLQAAGKSVILLEARDLALGASSRNAGFMLSGLDKYYHQAEALYGPQKTREVWQLSQRTHAFWHTYIQQYKVPFEPIGSLLLAESEAEARDLEQAARRLEAEGFPGEFLSRDPLGRGYFAALRQPQDGALHPYQLAQALFKASGATLINNSEVYAWETRPQAVKVHSRRAMVEAEAALICTNAYSRDLDLYFKGKVIPTRAQCLATGPLPQRVIGAVGYSDYGYMYYRDLPDGGFLLGGGRKQNVALEDDTTEDRITDPVQQVLEDYLRRWYPDVIETAPIVRRWSGIMAFTADGLPLIGALPQDRRLAFAIGCHGHGLSLGAAVAERAVEFLLKGTHPGLFSADRW